MTNKTDGTQLERDLLAEFHLYPGMTLREAARGFIEDNRKHMDPHVLKFFAACAIKAGDDALAASILGVRSPSLDELSEVKPHT